MANHRVFVSHISDEKTIAHEFKQLLTQSLALPPHEVFVSSDGVSIKAGEKWLGALSDALETVDVMVVLCSNQSIERPWVNFEAGAGWVRNVPIIPVCHSGLASEDLPMPLKVFQGPDPFSASGLKSIIESIGAHLNVTPMTVDYEVSAKKLQDVCDLAGRIENPKVLCAASAPYWDDPSIGLEGDRKSIAKSFGSLVRTGRIATAGDAIKLFGSEKFDIVHFSALVHPQSGDVIFAESAPLDKLTAVSEQLKLPPRAFADLMKECGARLVVLATCHCLPLTIALNGKTNVIGTPIRLTGDQAIAWSDTFYAFLASGKSLFDSFERTGRMSKVPMSLLPHVDFSVVPIENGGAPAAPPPSDGFGYGASR